MEFNDQVSIVTDIGKVSTVSFQTICSAGYTYVYDEHMTQLEDIWIPQCKESDKKALSVCLHVSTNVERSLLRYP